jgi:AraC family transcriptional regulator of arabinose operon
MPYFTSTRELLAKPIIAGSFRASQRYSVKRTLGTDDCLLVYTVSGAGRFGYVGGEVVATERSLVLATPHTVHDYGTAAGNSRWELLWTHFQPRAHWDELLSWPIISPGLMRIDLREAALAVRVEGLFRNVLAHANSGRPKAAQFALTSLEEMLLWCDTVNPLEAHSMLDSRIRSAVEHICANLAGDLGIETIASDACLSTSRFSHLFHEQMDISPQKFIEAKRIERARTLLAATERTVADIAADVGFDTPFYFSIRFKKATGTSPTAYRELSMPKQSK